MTKTVEYMPLFRIVVAADLEQIVKTGFVPKNHEEWARYAHGTVICMFECADFKAQLRTMGSVIGALWGLKPGDSVYALQFTDVNTQQVATDESAYLWENSKVYTGDIPENEHGHGI
jgi:hypothetical protein